MEGAACLVYLLRRWTVPGRRTSLPKPSAPMSIWRWYGERGAASFPQPKTICVQDKYPNANKWYVPLCTVVHQCAMDTGCCDAEYESCKPKSIQRVERTFWD
ncbi:hypothetical protein MTO96_003337 [Rhipicephalus appendiculatus]